MTGQQCCAFWMTRFIKINKEHILKVCLLSDLHFLKSTIEEEINNLWHLVLPTWCPHGGPCCIWTACGNCLIGLFGMSWREWRTNVYFSLLDVFPSLAQFVVRYFSFSWLHQSSRFRQRSVILCRLGWRGKNVAPCILFLMKQNLKGVTAKA